MAKTRQPVPSRKNLTGVRTITIAINYTSSSKKNSDDFFAALAEAFTKATKGRARQIENDTKVNAVKLGRITWDES